MSVKLCQWALCAVCLVAAGDAVAAGFWSLDQGVSSYGRGGTGIAAPLDPIAIHTNPAALAGLRDLQVLVETDMVFDARTFTRAPDNIDFNDDGTGDFPRTYEAVANEYLSFPPSAGVLASYNLASCGMSPLTVGAAVFGPLRVHTELDPIGAQRYSQVSNHTRQIQYTLAAAYELPWARLRVGGALMLISQIFDNELALSTAFDSPVPVASVPEDPDFDALVHARATDHLIPVPTFALSFEPVAGWTVAAAVRLPYDVEAEGTAEVALGQRLGRELAGVPFARVDGNRIVGYLKLPAILRLAALYRDAADRFDVELAFVWEGWARNRRIIFDPIDISVTFPGIIDPETGEPFAIPLDDIVIDNRYRDTWSLRAGGKLRVVEGVALLRAGTYFERAAVGAARLSMGTMDLDKVGVTLGLRVDLPLPIWLDVAVGYVHWLTREVTATRIAIKNPLAVPAEERWPIANGTYENQQIVTMLGVGGRLDW